MKCLRNEKSAFANRAHWHCAILSHVYQGVPVVAEGKIMSPSISDGALVQRNQLSVSGEFLEETAGVAVPLENDVVSACMVQEVSKLDSSRPCTNDTITSVGKWSVRALLAFYLLLA